MHRQSTNCLSDKHVILPQAFLEETLQTLARISTPTSDGLCYAMPRSIPREGNGTGVPLSASHQAQRTRRRAHKTLPEPWLNTQSVAAVVQSCGSSGRGVEGLDRSARFKYSNTIPCDMNSAPKFYVAFFPATWGRATEASCAMRSFVKGRVNFHKCPRCDAGAAPTSLEACVAAQNFS